jgi:hypothetical protein
MIDTLRACRLGSSPSSLHHLVFSVVCDPVKLRGIAAGDMVDEGFFIILDRLDETLDKRMLDWAVKEKKFHGKFLGRGRNPKALKELMISRMTVAYDLAAAFMYLHENR